MKYSTQNFLDKTTKYLNKKGNEIIKERNYYAALLNKDHNNIERAKVHYFIKTLDDAVVDIAHAIGKLTIAGGTHLEFMSEYSRNGGED